MTWRRIVLGTGLVLTLASSVAAQQTEVAVVQGAPTLLRGESEYSGTGRRDPFRPFIIDNKRLQLTPLQKFELGQLKVAGVISGPTAPRAMVEDGGGMGYIVTVGTPMGPNGGIVTAILPGRIVIDEPVEDYYGKRSTHQVVMQVPADDGGDKESQNKR